MNGGQWFFITHPTRGVFVDADWDTESNGYKPRFKWSIATSEGYPYYSEEEARKEMRKWPVAIREKCSLKRMRRTTAI